MGFLSSLFGNGSDKATYFRKQRNVFGQPEVPGLQALTDQRINAIYLEVKNAIDTIAAKKNEAIPERTVNGIVRDLLIEEMNGNYGAQFDQMKEMYSEHPIQMLFWKGRSY